MRVINLAKISLFRINGSNEPFFAVWPNEGCDNFVFYSITGKLRDIGISDNFMKELGETFKNNTSALFVLVRKVTPEKVLEELKGFKGKVLKTSLAKDKEEELREVLEKS